MKMFRIYSAGDFVAWMKINPNYRRLDPTLPREIPVRFIEMTTRIRGRRTVLWLATSLLDAERYPDAGELKQGSGNSRGVCLPMCFAAEPPRALPGKSPPGSSR